MSDVRIEIFADHEVLHPPHRLKKALGSAGPSSSFDIDAVRRAEQALSALSPSFDAWMRGEVEILDRAVQKVREQGFDSRTGAALFRAVHDIKGSAATFGYPAAARIAGGLCRLLDALGIGTAAPMPLVDTHVEAIQAIVRQGARDEDETAAVLAARLEEVVDATLAGAA